MLAYIAHRLIQGVVVVTRRLLHRLRPDAPHAGNPAEMMLSEFGASAADLERLEQQLGLDQPWPEQYRDFLLAAVRGDLGRSLFSKREVTEQALTALPQTLLLTGSAIAVALLHRGAPGDRLGCPPSHLD